MMMMKRQNAATITTATAAAKENTAQRGKETKTTTSPLLVLLLKRRRHDGFQLQSFHVVTRRHDAQAAAPKIPQSSIIIVLWVAFLEFLIGCPNKTKFQIRILVFESNGTLQRLPFKLSAA